MTRRRSSTKLVEYKANEFDPELDIASCDTIVCVGNGVRNESLPSNKELAKLLGGKLAGTRPVCDRELLPVKLQVGAVGRHDKAQALHRLRRIQAL